MAIIKFPSKQTRDGKNIRELLIGIVIMLGMFVFGIVAFADELSVNVYMEFLGFAMTIGVIDRLNERRSRNELKERLVKEVKSSADGQAAVALDWLREEKWLKDNPLRKEDFYRANWENAYVGELNLEGADLSYANLKNVSNKCREAEIQWINLYDAHLENAQMEHAILPKADMRKTNLDNAYMKYIVLTGAQLNESDLTNATLEGADLQYADMTEALLFSAKLQGADLRGAKLDGIKWAQDGQFAATMPDGTLWTSRTDVKKFTDTKHPQFRDTTRQINLIRQTMNLQPLRLS